MSLISYVTRVHFADRVLEDALPEELGKLGVRRPLVVMDRDAGGEALERLLDALPVGADPSILHDDPRAPATGRDGVLGLGGEAALRQARRLAAAARPALPLIAVPTALACVGLEPALAGEPAAALPAAILCDPTLIAALDPGRLAETGLDALGHCVEAYLGAAWNPPADGIALDGVRRAAAHLERAATDGADLAARRELLAAALDAGLAAQKGLGGLEALARAVERETGLADRHGRAHAALLPPLMRFNAPAAGARFAALSDALGLAPGADIAEALGGLGARLGLPPRLGALGLGHAGLASAAAAAADHPASRTNPRHVVEEDYRKLLAEAL